MSDINANPMNTNVGVFLSVFLVQTSAPQKFPIVDITIKNIE